MERTGNVAAVQRQIGHENAAYLLQYYHAHPVHSIGTNLISTGDCVKNPNLKIEAVALTIYRESHNISGRRLIPQNLRCKRALTKFML